MSSMKQSRVGRDRGNQLRVGELKALGVGAVVWLRYTRAYQGSTGCVVELDGPARINRIWPVGVCGSLTWDFDMLSGGHIKFTQIQHAIYEGDPVGDDALCMGAHVKGEVCLFRALKTYTVTQTTTVTTDALGKALAILVPHLVGEKLGALVEVDDGTGRQDMLVRLNEDGEIVSAEVIPAYVATDEDNA